MANVQQGFGNSPADAYFSIPPVTRYFATACIALTTLVNFKLISPYLIYLSWSHILKLQVGKQNMQHIAGDVQRPTRMSAGVLAIFRQDFPALNVPCLCNAGVEVGIALLLPWRFLLSVPDPANLAVSRAKLCLLSQPWQLQPCSDWPQCCSDA